MTVRLILVNLCLVVIGMIFPGQSFARIEPTTCVGAWLFDEETDVIKDVSGNGNNGIIKGKPKWDESKFGKAIALDGVDDYVDCGNDNSLDIIDEITILAWVKRSHFNTDNVIVGKNNGNLITAGYGLFSYTQGFEFTFYSEGIWRRTTPRVPASPNQWHHIAGTYDGDNLYLYIDGEQKASLGYVGTITPAVGHPLNIAYWRSAIPQRFDGLIDEVSIWNRALAIEEIQVLMYTRPDVDDLNLVGYWSFDEGDGQVVSDWSGNGNYGILGSGLGGDSSDPNWTDSIPPVGICTVDELVERNFYDVLDSKASILEQLYETIAREEALWEYMDEAFHNGQLDGLRKGDMVKAKQRIHSAIKHEEHAGRDVDKSVDKLNNAMDTLGIE